MESREGSQEPPPPPGKAPFVLLVLAGLGLIGWGAYGHWQRDIEATRTLDKFEREQAEFFEKCRAEYLRRAAQFPQRIVVIDSTRAIEAIRAELTEVLEKLL